jgi:hypothetical protein
MANTLLDHSINLESFVKDRDFFNGLLSPGFSQAFCRSISICFRIVFIELLDLPELVSKLRFDDGVTKPQVKTFRVVAGFNPTKRDP